jgi:hypothetical protein
VFLCFILRSTTGVVKLVTQLELVVIDIAVVCFMSIIVLQIMALHGIGKVRMERIFSAREEAAAASEEGEKEINGVFNRAEDLMDILNMNEKTALRFLKANAADVVL